MAEHEFAKALTAHGEGFKAEYEGYGFWSMRKDGWPDYVTMGNGGNVFDGEYRCRDYIRQDLVDATVADRDALICDLLRLRCPEPMMCADCEHEEDEGCDFMTRALEMGVEVNRR